MHDFFKRMIHFRAKHPVLRRSDFFRDKNSSGYPEMSFHGTRPWELNENEPFLSFGVLYAEPKADYGTKEDTFIYCAVNAYWEETRFELPTLPGGMLWREIEYTGKEGRANRVIRDGAVSLMPRSLMLLVGKAET